MGEMQLTTPSYILLGILSSRDCSAYELAEQLGRGVDQLWASADRQRYDGLKRLDQLGLVESRKEANGRRKRTIYSITPAGRQALRDWQASPAIPPTMEFDGMVRVLVGDQGTIEDLRANLTAMRDQAEQTRVIFARHAKFILESDGGTFPEREHLFALLNQYMISHFNNVSDWATWALEQTEDWSDTSLPADMGPSRQALREAAEWLPPEELEG